MATITKGKTFISGETVEPADMHQLVDQATISFVTADDTDDSTLEASGGKLRVKDAGVTDAKLATGAVTGAAGGGKLAASAITSQTAIDTLASDDTLLIHDDSNTALRKVTWAQIVAAAQPAGSVVGSDYAELVGEQTYTGSTVAINVTSPTTSDGHLLLSKAYATSNASNHIVINASVQIDGSAGTYCLLMLFAGSTLIASRHSYNAYLPAQTFVIKHQPPSTSSVTYTVRAAVNSGNLFVNKAYANSPYVTGKNISSMFIQEIKA